MNAEDIEKAMHLHDEYDQCCDGSKCEECGYRKYCAIFKIRELEKE